ncbi:hypothetical protein E1285_35645 [Actinomadura sp. 7K507]|nr:hypothetical protein E1285_35645 [Actinomadura sp. 7K507]
MPGRRCSLSGWSSRFGGFMHRHLHPQLRAAARERLPGHRHCQLGRNVAWFGRSRRCAHPDHGDLDLPGPDRRGAGSQWWWPVSSHRSVSTLPPSEDRQLRPLPRSARRGRILLGTLLIATSAAVVAWLFVSAGNRADVLVIVRDLPVGTPVSTADLATTRAGVDAPVQTIPASRADEVVGKIAAVDLRAGSLLSPGQLTTTLTPGQGQQIVAVGLKASQLPVGALRPGDHVLVVPTPGTAGQDAASSGTSPLGREVAAAVDRVSQPDADGTAVVNLLIAAESGPTVAKQAALGRVALVVTARRP